LPVEKIKIIFRSIASKAQFTSILDFGSGTLFWADWFINEFNCTVYAVDNYYQKIKPQKQNTKCYSSLIECFNDCNDFSLVWACDVLHHLTPLEYNKFFDTIVNKTKVIIIKDIDSRHLFGNYMNKMHDKIINREKIYNIDPDIIKKHLEKFNYKIQYYYIPKLWYPHFLILGIKNENNGHCA
jgi:hypothetical protein